MTGMDISLIYPHQLFERHPAVKEGRRVALIEDPLFFGTGQHGSRCHRHKIILHRASMKMYHDTLKARDIEILYFEYDARRQNAEVIDDLVAKGYQEFHVADVADHRLSKKLLDAVHRNKVVLRIYETPLFLTPMNYARNFFDGESRYLMARFYQAQRKRMNILMEDGKPLGGKWSYDLQNRKTLPRGLTLPQVTSVRRTKYAAEACSYADERFPDCEGKSGDFWLPTSHREAKQWLQDFLENRLALFGDYEDAIAAEQGILFHSVLTPSLNTGLITPQEVVEATLKFAEEHDIRLNSLEGFIRQIIGWREFIRAMYELAGEQQRSGNFWNHSKGLPQTLYTGTTGIEPVDAVVLRVKKCGYCHHIERLMVLGNFMLLCGIDPNEVYRWFMELFVDAYDWVMVPNVYGMSQFADGGVFATKPYVCSANYILKMSDFRRGPWSDIWNSLFWSFISRNRSYFQRQPRLSLMASQLGRLGKSLVREHERRAERFLAALK
jgi:deoxyribodipyrimidine photolyase-related protein